MTRRVVTLTPDVDVTDAARLMREKKIRHVPVVELGRDGLDAAAAAGVRAVIQPGGSVRDDEVIAAADEHGIAMVFTHQRHFRH